MTNKCQSIQLAIVLLFSFLQASMAQKLAFPGAEGYGKYTVGGNGGRTIVVTNLNDSGEGSLRAAVEAEGARTVVFNVSGNIELLTPLRINNDSITILGQTSPGMGICIKDCPLVVNASEVIVRYLRVRPGDKYTRDSDALGGGRYGQRNVILDHLSVSWSIDECLSIYKTENLTVQWCLVAHSLTKSVHTKGSHGFGGIWGGNKATFHHNLLANHSSRNPRISSVDGTKNVDVRNNAIYNWGFKAGYGGGHYATVNLVNNYYKPGPATTHIRFFDVADDRTGKYYIHGNVMEGNKKLTRNNKKGVGDKPHKDGDATCLVDEPFAYEPIELETATQAYQRILQDVGCSHQRDSYDTEVIRQVREGLGTFGNKGHIDTPADAGGWPELTSCLPAVNPNATPEAKELLKQLYATAGQGKIISGLHHNQLWEPNYSKDLNRIGEASGKTPLIWGGDVAWDADKVVEMATEHYRKGYIITLMWHAPRPFDKGIVSFKNHTQGKITDEQWNDLITPGTEMNRLWLAQVDSISGYLRTLQERNIPVIWRPLHEMNGGWFWWGNRKGADGYQKLWCMLYERMTVHNGLNNLVWVWNANATQTWDKANNMQLDHYYPGGDVVDVLATDIYNNDWRQCHHDDLATLAAGKLIAIGETGNLPTPQELDTMPRFAWFMIWTSFTEEKYNSLEGISAIFNDKRTINK